MTRNYNTMSKISCCVYSKNIYGYSNEIKERHLLQY